MDINLVIAIFCLLAVSYIIYLEFKNPYKERDVFIDIIISVILIIASIFELYELNFNFNSIGSWLFVVLIIMGIFYLVLVILHNKKYQEMKKNEPRIEEVPIEEEINQKDKENESLGEDDGNK